MSRLRNTIVRTFADLDALGCSWAVVGGLAVSAHANPRTTRDLDVAVSVEGDAEAEQLVRALLARGYAVEGAEVARDSLREIERRGFSRNKELVTEFEALRRELGSDERSGS